MITNIKFINILTYAFKQHVYHSLLLVVCCKHVPVT